MASGSQDMNERAEGYPSDPARMLAINSEHHLRAENLPFDIDVWYPLVREHTFRSVFVPLTRQEAAAMVNYYRSRYILKEPSLTTRNVRDLQAFEERLGKVLHENGFADSGGAFMRMCGRSPKDGEPLHRRPVCASYIREVHRLNNGTPCDVVRGVDVATKLQAIARVPWMRVRSGAECMNLLLTSERVYADLVDWLHYGEPEQIVFRAWEDGMTLDHEFRAYISNNRMTAISQYDHYGVYAGIQGREDEIRRLILAEWERIHALVGVPSYCADFVYIPGESSEGGEGAKAVLIELSPFLTCTGPALFSWTADRDLLHGTSGQTETVVRINQSLRPGLDDLISANWEQRWGLIDDRGGVMPSDGADVDAAVAQHVEEHRPYSDWYALAPRPSAKAAIRTAVLRIKNKIRAPSPILLFVYGTLKSGFQWSSKFLGRSTLVGPATSQELFPLVLGQCGVPYLLGDLPGKGQQVRGEVWAVDGELLAGMDDYEGVSKGYYCRRSMEAYIETSPPRRVTAFVYVLSESTPDLRLGPFLEEYSMEMHREQYRPIMHIQIKQQLYMNTTFTTSTT